MPSPPVCFPEDTAVKVMRSCQLVEEPIQNLALGDTVKCISQTTKQISMCTVFAHFHPAKDAAIDVTYHEISYVSSTSPEASPSSITLSSNHLMYRLPPSYTIGSSHQTIPDFSSADGLVQFPPAENIQVGDLIAVEDSTDENFFLVGQVVKNEVVSRNGAYSPGVSDGLMLFADGAVASSLSLPPDDDPLAVLVNENIAQYLMASIYRYFFSLIDTGVVDTTEFWGRTRDDPVYIQWENENDNYWLGYMITHIIPTAFGALQSNLTLTGSNAILFNDEVIKLTDWPLDEEVVADLLEKAYNDEISSLF